MEPEGQAAVQWAGSPRGEATIRLATALLLAAGLLVSQGCETEELVPPMSEGVSYVVPFGEVSGAEIERARWALEVATRRPVVLLPTSRPPAGRWGRDRRRRRLPRRPDPPAPARHLPHPRPDVDPLLAEGEPVIGYSRIGERALVYSTFLLPRYATEAVRRGGPAASSPTSWATPTAPCIANRAA
ncbi:MAG: hypothetical protein R3F43_02265 [bacterium]